MLRILFLLIVLSFIPSACTPDGDGGGSGDATSRDTSQTDTQSTDTQPTDTQPTDTLEPLEDGVLYRPKTRQRNETCVEHYDCVRGLICRSDSLRCDEVTCDSSCSLGCVSGCAPGTGCLTVGVCSAQECSGGSISCTSEGLGAWCSEEFVCVDPN